MPKSAATKALSAEHRARLFSLISTDGETTIVAKLGVSRSTVARALASLPIHGGSRLAIEVGLSAINAEGAS